LGHCCCTDDGGSLEVLWCRVQGRLGHGQELWLRLRIWGKGKG
jgi:hypothetical protein